MFLTELNTGPYETTAENESDINLVFIGHLNSNSIRSKFEMLQFLPASNIDILLISESKLDGTFPSSQFQIYGFRTPYRLDRNHRGEGILLFL